MAHSKELLKNVKKKLLNSTQDSATKNFTGQLADFRSQQGQAMQFVPCWKNNRKGRIQKNETERIHCRMQRRERKICRYQGI